MRRRFAPCVLALRAGAVRLLFWRHAPAQRAFGFGAVRRRSAPHVLALCAGAVRLVFWRCAPALRARVLCYADDGLDSWGHGWIMYTWIDGSGGSSDISSASDIVDVVWRC